MKKTLIINLKRFGDIFQTGHLVSTLRKNQPNHEIHLLCYEECATSTKILKGITKVHTLDRKKITSYYKNNIYSDGLAINDLQQKMEEVNRESFDRVINYSNDKTSTYLSSFLANSTTEIAGISFTPKQTINYSNNSAIILNDIVTQTDFTPFNFNDLYHQLVEETYTELSVEKVKSNKMHDKTALNNLDRLRAIKNDDSSSVSIVGFQICSSSVLKDIPFDTLTKVIKSVFDHPNMVPIIIIAPTAKERAFSNKVNDVFDNKLVSVESDFIALPSVLKNIDLLVTPDTSVKHLADLVDTPVLEVSLGHAPFMKQGTINTRSAIITAPPHLRIFKEGGEPEEKIRETNSRLSETLIFHTILSLLGTEGGSVENEISDFCVYRPVKVVDGIYHMPVSGPISGLFEAKRVLGRAIIQKIFKGVVDENLIESSYTKIDRRDFQKAIEEEKEALSMLTKELLSTLRGLIQTQESKTKAPAFIEALEKLLSRCFDRNLAALPALVFRAQIESLNSDSLESNFKEVEALLYTLKDNLQKSLSVYKTCEEIGYGVKSIQRRSEIRNEGQL